MAAVASRYARAFADVVLSKGMDPASVRAELQSAVELVSDTPELRNVWSSPAVPHDQKIRLLDSIAQRAGYVTAVRNFLAVLIEHGRVAALPAIARQFNTELNTRLGLAEAEVVSARPLSDEARRALEAQLASVTGAKVIAKYTTDPKVLGGAVVRVGSTVYDGSVRGQLQRIRESLVEQ